MYNVYINYIKRGIILDNKEASKSETFLGCGCLIFIVVIIALILHFFVFGKDDSKKSDTSSSKVATSKIASSSSMSSKKSDEISDDFITTKKVYNDALILVAQHGDKKEGLASELTGIKILQESVITHVHDAFYQNRNNENAKKNGIAIVSYVDGDVLAVFYASPDDLQNMSEIIPSSESDLKKFLQRDITGFYINGLYLKSVMGSNYGFFNNMSLVNQDNMPDWVKQDVSTGAEKFI